MTDNKYMDALFGTYADIEPTLTDEQVNGFSDVVRFAYEANLITIEDHNHLMFKVSAAAESKKAEEANAKLEKEFYQRISNVFARG